MQAKHRWLMEEDRTENVDTVAQNDKWKKMKQKKLRLHSEKSK